MKRSPWVIHYDASSCNGCDIEVLACLTPVFDVERLGVVNTGNPKHADIFLVTGAVNPQSKDVIRNIYRQMPEPKVVIAVGTCACSGGIFRECYNISGGIDTILPVDVYVPGCAVRPEAIIDSVVQSLGVLEQKHHDMKTMAQSVDQTLYLRADKTDLPAIMALQKIVYTRDTEVYGEESQPALKQTMAGLEDELAKKVFIKAVINGKIIGSARGFVDGELVRIGNVIVHPYCREAGIESRMLQELKQVFGAEKRFDIFMGRKSEQTRWAADEGRQITPGKPLAPVTS